MKKKGRIAADQVIVQRGWDLSEIAAPPIVRLTTPNREKKGPSVTDLIRAARSSVTPANVVKPPHRDAVIKPGRLLNPRPPPDQPDVAPASPTGPRGEETPNDGLKEETASFAEVADIATPDPVVYSHMQSLALVSQYDAGYEVGCAEGFEDGFAAGHREGFAAGQTTGCEQGNNTALAQAETKLALLDDLQRCLTQAISERDAALTHSVSDLVAGIAGVVLMGELQMQPDRMNALVGACLDAAGGAKNLSLSVSESMVSLVSNLAEGLHIAVSADSTLAPGSCELKTSAGNVSLGLSARLCEAVETALQEAPAATAERDLVAYAGAFLASGEVSGAGQVTALDESTTLSDEAPGQSDEVTAETERE